VVVNDLEIADVTVLLHHLQELDDDLGVRPDENLALAALLGIHDVVQAVTEDTDPHHSDRSLGRLWASSGKHLA